MVSSRCRQGNRLTAQLRERTVSPHMSESSLAVKGAQYSAVKTQHVRSHSSIDMTLDELISDLQTVRNQSRAPLRLGVR